MKKIRLIFIALALICALIIVAVSCNSGDEPQEGPNTNSGDVTTETTETSDIEDSSITTEPPHVHAFGEWETTKEPSCTAKGLKIRKCSCGENETEEIDALGHNEVPHEAKAPNCTEIGWDAYVTCSNCDYTTKVEKDAIGHSYSDAWEKDTTHHWHKADCEHTNEISDKSEHNFGEDLICDDCGFEKENDDFGMDFLPNI